jgi:hypothetical protein
MTHASRSAIRAAKARDLLKSFSAERRDQFAFDVNAGRGFDNAQALGEGEQVIDVPVSPNLSPIEISNMPPYPGVEGVQGRTAVDVSAGQQTEYPAFDPQRGLGIQ